MRGFAAGSTAPASPNCLPVDLPTDEQLDALIKMVVDRYPRLEDAHRARRSSTRCTYLAFAYRPDKLATQYATHFWLDTFKEWAN